jgi:hypothetical protein
LVPEQYDQSIDWSVCWQVVVLEPAVAGPVAGRRPALEEKKPEQEGNSCPGVPLGFEDLAHPSLLPYIG